MIFTSYSQLYSIKTPAIYETVFYQQKAKIDDLSSIKQALEAKVASLKTTIDQTSDRLLRCPLTGLYNQVVMNQHLLDNLDQPLQEKATRALLVIHIDNLLSINKKYGTAKGDDTLRGLVPRLQTIEYLRAFTSGRIGWSQARSLMIISRAFGLFNKRALIETGGYLTSSCQFKKDTVGEDMELVVRLTREYLEKKKEYRVTYVSNAYCYTELPSEAKTLLKQRNRWQRGLVNILSFHRKIIFNPRFKQIGMLGAPYFLSSNFLGLCLKPLV